MRRCPGLFALGVLAACADPPPAEPWIHLARTPELMRLRPAPESRWSLGGERTLTLSITREEAVLSFDCAPGDWAPTEGTCWTTNLPLRTRPRDLDGRASLRVSDAAGELALVAVRGPEQWSHLPPRTFTCTGQSLVIHPGAAAPAERTHVEVHFARGRRELAPIGPTLRFSGRRYAGEALVVWPGERLERTLDVPPASTLRYAVVREPILAVPLESARARFRVTLDGVPLHEEALAGRAPFFRWCSAVLPPGGRAGARLAFEVEGDFANTAFLAPVIGPARPGPHARPDIVLFLADTFRADNLRAYGGTGETPFLDALAETSLVFRNTWAAGPYTLPSHTTLFSGLHPYQSGLTSAASSMSRELSTVAEVLAANGYRTGAVTDALFVSQTYGMDQGFEVFDELQQSLASTHARARAFLEADDGRPVFLFVHTYKTHMPYVISEAEQEVLGADYATQSQLLLLESEYDGLAAEGDSTPEEDARRAEIAARLRTNYLGTVHDLDRGFARFHAELAQRGFFEHGVLVFTSDHGEAFDEHRDVFHSGEVYEELLRVPLLLRGAGIRPGVVRHPAGHIDLARTLADLAGCEPAPEWFGTSLLGLDRDRPMFAFRTQGGARETSLCVVEGGRKVIAGQGGAVLQAAFDLGADPGERADLARSAAWPGEVLERYREAIASLLEAHQGSGMTALTTEDFARLEAMGYAGGR